MKNINELNSMLDEGIIDLDTYWEYKLKRIEDLQFKRGSNIITTEELDELLDYFNENECEDDCIDEAERVGLHQTQWGWM